MILWQDQGRWLGGLPVAAALAAWVQTQRPATKVADSGGLVVVLGPQGRALSRVTGDALVASVWLENDGGPVPHDVAAARAGLVVETRMASAELGSWTVLQVRGKEALAQTRGCGGVDVLISNQVAATPRPCAVFDITQFRQTGALAFNLDASDNLVITTAAGLVGRRPWHRTSGVRARLVLTDQ